MSFESDLEGGEIVEQYLMDHLFPKIAESYDPMAEHGDETEGGDIVATIPGIGDDLIIDVKSQIDYIGYPRPRFVLELSYEIGGAVRQGWLFDESNPTTHYLFVWIHDADEDPLSVADDINTVDAVLVGREEVRDFLDDQGLDRERIQQDAAEVREEGNGRAVEIDHDDMKYYFSGSKSERPVNIVVEYDVYEELADGSYVIDDGVLMRDQSYFWTSSLD